MEARKKMGLPLKILIGFIVGIILGLIFKENILKIQFLGDMFTKLIKMTVLPLVFFSIVNGIASMGDMKKLRTIGIKTILYFVVTTVIAGLLALVILRMFSPGAGLVISSAGNSFEPAPVPTFSETIVSMVPENIVESFADGNMIHTIVFGAFIGVALTALGEKTQKVNELFEKGADIMYKITSYVMAVSPIGIGALIACTVGSYGLAFIGPLTKFIVADFSTMGLFVITVYVFMIKFIAKMPVGYFFRKILRVWAMTLSTTSSAGTLPVTMDVGINDYHLHPELASFVLPLGATINMNGSCIYLTAVTVFASQIYGLNLSFAQMLFVVFTATMLAIGAPGMPGGGIFLTIVMLSTLNLPLELVGMIAGIYRFLDMPDTSLNVTGDLVTACCIARTNDMFVGDPFPISKKLKNKEATY